MLLTLKTHFFITCKVLKQHETISIAVTSVAIRSKVQLNSQQTTQVLILLISVCDVTRL